ncbi:MAG: hypothetical protein ORN29_05180, partial [Rhodoferax sp.]|nr:hypothetical protein [Rhodoferax sp.]
KHLEAGTVLQSCHSFPKLNMTSTHSFPTTGVATFVADLARLHKVTYVRTGNDALADLITSYSDDKIVPDATEDLVVALARAKVIDDSGVLALLSNHINEREHVRSVW